MGYVECLWTGGSSSSRATWQGILHRELLTLVKKQLSNGTNRLIVLLMHEEHQSLASYVIELHSESLLISRASSSDGDVIITLDGIAGFYMQSN